MSQVENTEPSPDDPAGMQPDRLAAFTDGVIAIIITILVLDLRVPHQPNLTALHEVMPVLAAYAVSFATIGIYWNNHHHMIYATDRVNGRVLWANLLLLFWLSLVPFVIRWSDEAGFAAAPVAAYGIVMGLAALSYTLLERSIVAANSTGSSIARALKSDRKGLSSILLYLVAVPLAFVERWIAMALYLAVIAMWFVPDRRMATARRATTPPTQHRNR